MSVALAARRETFDNVRYSNKHNKTMLTFYDLCNFKKSFFSKDKFLIP